MDALIKERNQFKRSKLNVASLSNGDYSRKEFYSLVNKSLLKVGYF